MKFSDKIVRWFVGGLFIFSGLVKLNDPIGTAIKMEEYFEVFSSDISGIFHYLVPYALLIGLVVIFLEILLGVAVLINFRMQITSRAILLLIVFFTFLTFYSAAFNKVTDCGCFGDAIPLTPWQSFAKDILLLVLSIFLVIRSKNYFPVFEKKIGKVILGITFAVNILIAYFSIEHLPIIDFRPYKIGVDIEAAMKPSEDYIYKYIMLKNGERFDFESYPTDTSYKFVEMVLMNPEAEPKITDYNVWNDDGDFTNETFRGVKLLVLYNDVNKADLDKTSHINKLVGSISEVADSWIITANDEATFENFRHEYQIAMPYFFADGTVIKAMIRANPGLILLKDGIVIGKWHNNDIPSKDDIVELID